jgi:hypothetical protein
MLIHGAKMEVLTDVGNNSVGRLFESTSRIIESYREKYRVLESQEERQTAGAITDVSSYEKLLSNTNNSSNKNEN